MTVKDAASLIVVDKRKAPFRFLMGRRAAKHKFMPNIYVFPGGRVDYTDRFAPYINDYSPQTLDLLMQQTRQSFTPLRARMLGIAALRETFEEVGLTLGTVFPKNRPKVHASWQAFSDTGLLPDLSRLRLIARAITPPYQSRRFDTRFFIADASADLCHQTICESEELEDLRWVTIQETQDLPLHFITKQVLIAASPALNEQRQINVSFFQAKRGEKKGLTKIHYQLRPGAAPLPPVEVSDL